MDHKVLLTKCITLLYKQSLLKEPDLQTRVLIEEVIQKIQPREVGVSLGTERDSVDGLKSTLRDLLSTPHDQGIDRTALLQRLRINTGENEKLYKAIESGIIEEQTHEELIASINACRKSIQKHVSESKVSDILSSATASWNYKRDSIKDTRTFLQNMWVQLEPMASLKTKEDPAIINQIRIGDELQLKKIVENIRVSVIENRYYKTGWQGLNRMLQGGFRRGEFWITAALQHKYKTGFAQSIFNHIALYNKPFTNIAGKKPALVLFSFEDTIEERFHFIVKQLMFNETRQFVDVSTMTTEQMQSYILHRLHVNGFEIFFYRVDPSRWVYQDIFNMIIELENDGYSIEAAVFDYLEKIPTTGCIQYGPPGNDILDLFGRVRTFLNARGITGLTPHQLSTESKKLIRGPIGEDKFVQALVGKGYYKGSSQLDQVPDGILLTHVFKHGPEWYLAIQRDRHRLTSIVKESYKHMYLKFPEDMPIPDDINGEDSTLYKLPAYRGNASEELFTFDT